MAHVNFSLIGTVALSTASIVGVVAVAGVVVGLGLFLVHAWRTASLRAITDVQHRRLKELAAAFQIVGGAAPQPVTTTPDGVAPASWSRSIVAGVAAGALASAAIVAAVILLRATGATGHPHPGHLGSLRPKPTPVDRLLASVHPSAVTVAILDGSPRHARAEAIAVRLANLGFAAGPIVATAGPRDGATVIAYTRGHRTAAEAISAALALRSARVHPATLQDRLEPCPAAPCRAGIIVTVGSKIRPAAVRATRPVAGGIRAQRRSAAQH